MSNYCKNCSYKATNKTEPQTCPFNYLYWDVFIRNRNILKQNHRIKMSYKTYERMSNDKKTINFQPE